MGPAREIQRLELLKHCGVIWEYVVEPGILENDISVTVWLRGCASEPVEHVLVAILGGAVPCERIHVVRERPPIVTHG